MENPNERKLHILYLLYELVNVCYASAQWCYSNAAETASNKKVINNASSVVYCA